MILLLLIKPHFIISGIPAKNSLFKINGHFLSSIYAGKILSFSVLRYLVLLRPKLKIILLKSLNLQPKGV